LQCNKEIFSKYNDSVPKVTVRYFKVVCAKNYQIVLNPKIFGVALGPMGGCSNNLFYRTATKKS
jgi:hypothetical protein